jgi:eukaryotic-like serine/threonine-protein kinase
LKSMHIFLACSMVIVMELSACQSVGKAAADPTLAPIETPIPQPSPTLETTMNTHWSFQTGAAVWGSPSLSDGTVFIGSDDGNLYALDARSGNLEWKFASQGIVRSKPAVEAGLVYFASDDGNLYALHVANGDKAWSTNIGNFLDKTTREDLGGSPDPNGYDYVQSSPIVADGTVFVGSLDGNLYALAADTGAVQWTFTTKGKIRGTAAVDQGTVYFGSWDKLMYALDARSGEVRWATGVGGQVQSAALVANGLVYCASRKASAFALDAATGALKWEHNYGGNMWVESSPRLVDGVIYIGSSGSKFILGLDALSGKPTAIYISPDFHWSTPLVIRDTLYIGGTSYKPELTAGLFSLKIVDGKFSSDGSDLQIFSANNTLEYSGNWLGVAGSPATENDLIYFGALDGKVYAVNALP